MVPGHVCAPGPNSCHFTARGPVWRFQLESIMTSFFAKGWQTWRSLSQQRRGSKHARCNKAAAALLPAALLLGAAVSAWQVAIQQTAIAQVEQKRAKLKGQDDPTVE